MWAFHFTTLTEYYTGILELEMCNAVTDGSVVFIIFFVFSGIVGSEFWLQEAFEMDLGAEMKYVTLGQLIFSIASFLVLISLVAEFVKILKSRSKPKETQSEYPDFRHLLLQVLGIALFSAIWLWFGYTGSKPIFAANLQVTEELYKAQESEPEAHASAQVFHLMLYCFVICHTTIWVQLCHVSR